MKKVNVYADCDASWQVAGTITPAYDVYHCTICGSEYNDYTGEGVERNEAGYWSWLIGWLNNFKDWLRDWFHKIVVAIQQDSDAVTVNNYNITYTDDEGTEQEFSIADLKSKFNFLKQLKTIAMTLYGIAEADAEAAEDAASGVDALTLEVHRMLKKSRQTLTQGLLMMVPVSWSTACLLSLLI